MDKKATIGGMFEPVFDDELIFLEEDEFEYAKRLYEKRAKLARKVAVVVKEDIFKAGKKPGLRKNKSVGRMIFSDDAFLLNIREFGLDGKHGVKAVKGGIGAKGAEGVNLENGVDAFIDGIIDRYKSGVKIVDKNTGENISGVGLTDVELEDEIRLELLLTEENGKGLISGISRWVRSIIGSV